MSVKLTAEQSRFVASALRIAADTYLHDALVAKGDGNARIAEQFARQAAEACRIADHIDGDDVEVLR